MPISKFSCPHCRAVLKTSRPGVAGKTTKCPECGERFTVRPDAAERAPAPASGPKRAEAKDGTKQKPSAPPPPLPAPADEEAGTYGMRAEEDVGPMPELTPQDKPNRKREAEEHVHRPATLLQTTGMLTFIINFVGIFVWIFPLVFSEHLVDPDFPDDKGQVVHKAWEDVTPAEMATVRSLERGVRAFRIIMAVACFLAVLYGGLIYHGGLKMQYLESYGWALTASIMALIPVDFWLLGLPAGIMGLLALRREDVREGFEQAALSGDDKRPRKKRRRKRPGSR